LYERDASAYSRLIFEPVQLPQVPDLADDEKCAGGEKEPAEEIGGACFDLPPLVPLLFCTLKTMPFASMTADWSTRTLPNVIIFRVVFLLD
jgi:hypothetical protein